MIALRGVNLGGWLVLEKWMTPSLFDGTTAVDEYTFCETADKARLVALQRHRDHFITEADFAWISKQGLTAVRLPVGYWCFGDVPPYQATDSYIEQTLQWAEHYNLKVLLSVHGAPGSQNGQDHSGRVGPIDWPRDRCNIQTTEAFVQELAARYGQHAALWGIELLNEPSPKISKWWWLKPYYQTAYQAARQHSAQSAIVISDGFKPRRYKRVLKAPRYTDTYIDTHQYQVFTEADRQLDLVGHIYKTAGPVRRELAKMAQHHAVIVGEWSGALDDQSLKGLDAGGRERAYQAYIAAQLAVYETTRGWFYWSYKTEDDGPWNYRASVERGRIPSFR